MIVLTLASKKTRLYSTWIRLRALCNYRSHPSFQHYGGRGIIICEEWDEFETFRKWALDNGWDMDSDKCFIRRYDEDDDFVPYNCYVHWKNPR